MAQPHSGVSPEDAGAERSSAGASRQLPLVPMDEWKTSIKLVRIDHGSFFAAIFRDMEKWEKAHLPAGTGFYNNLGPLVEAYATGDLYTLTAELMTNSQLERTRGDPFFIEGPHTPMRTLPCFIAVSDRDPTVCTYIWVHPRAQRMGLGTTMVNALEIRSAEEVLPESVPFWKTFEDVEMTGQ